MEVIFRKLSSADAIVAQTGDIYLVPAVVAQRGCREIAKFVLEKGLKALLRGAGKVERLVIDADPKLDDMLAAAFFLRLVKREPFSPGCAVFAEYAARLRDSYRPTEFPLENSLEGIFLAMRHGIEKPLTEQVAGQQFLADWRRLENVIFLLAEEDHDPFEAPLFELNSSDGKTYSLRSVNRGNPGMGEADFAREFMFLLKDQETYQQDVSHGDKWTVRLPGDSGEADGLLLRNPKSLLFKYWTRSPCPSPTGGPFRFLAIIWGSGQWAFSTSSKKQISLKPLAEILQKMEPKSSVKEDKDSWNAGKPPHVIVSSPRGGSRLAEANVVRAVKQWCGVKSFSRRRKLSRVALLAGGLAAVLAVGLFFWQPWQTKRPRLEIDNLFVLSVGIGNLEHFDGELPSAPRDADEIAKAFKVGGGHFCERVFVLDTIKNKKATKNEILKKIAGVLEEGTSKGMSDKSLLILTFSGHGDIEKESEAYFFCPYDFDGKATSGIFLSELQRYTNKLPCPVIFVFDTCHSGTRKKVPSQPGGLLSNIRKSLDKGGNQNGLVIMAACAPHQTAGGGGDPSRGQWGHGLLTLALLEGIRAKDRYEGPKAPVLTPLPKPGNDGIVTLDQLDYYVKLRVRALSTESNEEQRLQEASTHVSGDISLEQIPISRSR